jgi:hypothetical protein
MREQQLTRRGNAFDLLRQFARHPTAVERCAMCSAELGAGHQHLVELANRKLVCACDACAILFDNQGPTKYRRVPRRVRFLADFQIMDSRWDSLMMPINMAFFFKSTPKGKVIAMYPSPAGATESLLSLDAWEEISQENPILQEMAPDVEALLANRLGYSRGFTRAEYYLAPIDECYKLVGLIRTHWRGLSGGVEVWLEMAHFFADLKAKSDPGASNA